VKKKHLKNSHWEDCEYISPGSQPDNWKSNPKGFAQVNKVLDLWTLGKVDWFIKKFKYNHYKNSKPTPSNSISSDLPKSEKPEDTRDKGSFITYSLFKSSVRHKLYNSWTLDNVTDIHVCNNIARSRFIKTHDTSPDDLRYAGKTVYTIEAYGKATVKIKTPAGIEQITLTNVALAPGFMTNLVFLRQLNDKGVYWFSKFPLCLLREEEYFCDLELVGDHLVPQRDTDVLEGIPKGLKTRDSPESNNLDRASYGTKTSTTS
jgi:hypothetical protein